MLMLACIAFPAPTEGAPGNPATLWKFRPMSDPQEIKGAKILYNRRTGEFHLEGGKVLQSWLDRLPPPRCAIPNRLEGS